MLGKKDNQDIFKNYRQVLLEQKQDGGIADIVNKIKTSSIDNTNKSILIMLLSNPQVANIYKTMISQQAVRDADTAGYSSYPEASPASSDVNSEVVAKQPSQKETEDRKKTIDQIFKKTKEENEEDWFRDNIVALAGKNALDRYDASKKANKNAENREKYPNIYGGRPALKTS